MAITPLPTPPSRSDSANFASRGDAFMAALPTFVTETNATAAAMEAALQTSMLGVTASSTTSLAIGTGSKSLTVETGKGFVVGMSLKIASTAGPSNYMIGTVTGYTSGTGALTVDVDTVGGSGTVAAWTVSIATMGDIDVAGGASETTSAIDITLTASSPRVQVINMTATGKIVILPDATTMSEGGLAYIFRATGNSYLVLSSTGKFVATAESGKVAQVSLVDNSTAAGTWTGQMIADNNPGFGVGVASVFESANTIYMSTVWLDDSRCLVTYKDSGNSAYLTGCVLTKSGASFVPGTAFVIVSEAFNYNTTVLIGTDKVLVTYYNTTVSYGKAVAFTISGASLDTVGISVAIATTTAGDGNAPTCCRVADNTVFVYYRAVSTGYLVAKILTVSGTTITVNAADTYNFSATQMSCCLLDTNKVMALFQQGAAAAVAVVYIISGTTLTRGTAISIDGSIACSYSLIRPLSTTKALAFYANTGSPYSLRYCVLSISGTTITAGTAAELSGSTTKYPSGLYVTSDSSAYGLWMDNNYLVLAQLTISANTVTAATIWTSSMTVSGEPVYTGSNHLDLSLSGVMCLTYTAVTTSYGTALLLVG